MHQSVRTLSLFPIVAMAILISNQSQALTFSTNGVQCPAVSLNCAHTSLQGTKTLQSSVIGTNMLEPSEPPNVCVAEVSSTMVSNPKRKLRAFAVMESDTSAHVYTYVVIDYGAASNEDQNEQNVALGQEFTITTKGSEGETLRCRLQ